MIVKTVTYEDFNGNERTEDFYFNMTEAEAAEKEWSVNGGWTALLKRAVQTQDQAELIKIFKEFVIDAYGVKSIDGKTMDKSEEVKKAFASSAAYSKIFMELARSDEAAAEFINGVLPAAVKMEEKPAALPGKAPIEVVKPE